MGGGTVPTRTHSLTPRTSDGMESAESPPSRSTEIGGRTDDQRVAPLPYKESQNMTRHLSRPPPGHMSRMWTVEMRQSTLQQQDYYPPNLNPLSAFASTPCTSLTQADAVVVLETALLWVRPERSHAVVHAGALAMQNGCARLLAIDHGYLENIFSDANR